MSLGTIAIGAAKTFTNRTKIAVDERLRMRQAESPDEIGHDAPTGDGGQRRVAHGLPCSVGRKPPSPEQQLVGVNGWRAKRREFARVVNASSEALRVVGQFGGEALASLATLLRSREFFRHADTRAPLDANDFRELKARPVFLRS